MTEDQISAFLDVAIAAARRSGEILLSGLGASHQITIKKYDVDIVTEIDQRAEQEIVQMIRSAFPSHAIVAEEGSTGGPDQSHTWHVDPLDGTINYTHGYPLFATSIGLEVHGRPTVGVLYIPFLDELFVAAEGRGATLNGCPIHVSPTAALRRSLLATGFSLQPEWRARAMAAWAAVLPYAQSVRRDGSGAIDLAYVAAGRYDGFWQYDLSSWDVAAGLCIAQQAGAHVSSLDGGPWTVRSRHLLVTNPHIHDELLSILRNGHQS
jgi:myo-inositol-1(or 4)-monophosphatase